MSFTHRIVREWNSGSLQLNQSKEVTSELESNISISIPDSTTDQLVAWAIDITQLKSLHIQTTQDITIETNNPAGTSAAADDTLTLLANQPISWQEGDVMDHPFTADVTQIYVTNASGSAAQLDIRAGVDPTV